MWNELIQDRYNTNEAVTYRSYDCYNAVDDPHGYLASTLSNPEALHRFNETGLPPHELKLNVGDICLVLRTISAEEGLTTNTRVKS